MRRLTFLAACLLPVIAAAQSPQEIIDKAYEKQLERWEGVDSYAVTQTVMGTTTTTVFKRTQTTRPDGSPRVDFVPDVDAADYDGMDMTDASDQIMDVIDKAELVGKESINGRESFHLRANDVDALESFGQGQFTVDSISVWLDTDEYVPLKMSMDGHVMEGEDKRAGNIIVMQDDFRSVPGSSMYEPYAQTVSMQNVMSGKDRADFEEARKQLMEFEQQLAAMPEDQRAMMEQMMGPQLEAMRSMVQDGGLKIDIVVESIEINPN